MASYAEAALLAVVKLRVEREVSARAAWTMAVAETFPNSISMQKKGCPRTIFLTLCASGALIGIAASDDMRDSENARHALDCLALLDKHPSYVTLDPRKLWTIVTHASGKAYNQQMHVVLGLAKAGLLQKSEQLPIFPSASEYSGPS